MSSMMTFKQLGKENKVSDEQMVILPVKVFNQVTDYLLQQPYGSVSPLVDLLKENTRAVQSPETAEENNVVDE